MTDLGTLGGLTTRGLAVNDPGQVVGIAVGTFIPSSPPLAGFIGHPGF